MNSARKTATVAAGLALAGLLAVGVAMAGQRPMGGPHGEHGGPGGPGGPMMFLLSKLDLSDDQKTQVKAILDDEQPKIAPLADASMKARHALEAAIHAPAFDESTIRAAAAQAGKAEADLAVERGRLASRIRGALTPDQQKQLDALHQQILERRQQRAAERHGEWSESAPDSADAP